MQYATVLVALAGDLNNTVQKSAVSVPEVMVLMAAHGQDSVSIVPNSVHEERAESPAEQIARLRTFYGEDPVKLCFGEAKFGVRLPSRFSEVGIEVPDEDDKKDGKDDGQAETASQKRTRLKKERAAAEALAKVQAAGNEPSETGSQPNEGGGSDDSDDEQEGETSESDKEEAAE